jgi:hypothetical protein
MMESRDRVGGRDESCPAGILAADAGDDEHRGGGTDRGVDG